MTDVFGQRFKVGQYFVYTRAEHSADLKIGLVTGFAKETWADGKEVDAEIHAITVKYDFFFKKFKLQQNGRSVSIAKSHRCLILPPEMIPEYIKEMLASKEDWRHKKGT